MKVKISAYAFDEELMKTNGESLQVPLYASLAPHKTGWNVIDFPLQYIITSRRIVCACSSAPHAPCWNTFPYYQHTRSIFHWSSYCNSPPVALASFSALKHRKGFKGRLSILDVFFECSPGGCVYLRVLRVSPACPSASRQLYAWALLCMLLFDPDHPGVFASFGWFQFRIGSNGVFHFSMHCPCWLSVQSHFVNW